MPWPIDRKVATAFSVALLSVGLLGILAYTSMTQFLTSSRWASHAQAVLAELDDVPLEMEQAEGAQLRYLLTDDESYRAAYQTAADSVEKELDEVRQLTRENPTQRDRAATLTTLTKQRLASLQAAMRMHDTDSEGDAFNTMMANSGTATKEEIRNVSRDMETEEKQLLSQHEAVATVNARSMRRRTIGASALAFVLVGLAGVIVNRDVLKRRQAERELQASEARYRTLVESANEGIISITLDGKIASINHGLETMLDWSREELVGESYGKILTPTSAAQSEERLRHALAVERLPSIYEAESVGKDGTVVPVEVRAGFIRDGTGQILGLLALHRDISMRKALEQSCLDNVDDGLTQHDVPIVL